MVQPLSRLHMLDSDIPPVGLFQARVQVLFPQFHDLLFQVVQDIAVMTPKACLCPITVPASCTCDSSGALTMWLEYSFGISDCLIRCLSSSTPKMKEGLERVGKPIDAIFLSLFETIVLSIFQFLWARRPVSDNQHYIYYYLIVGWAWPQWIK